MTLHSVSPDAIVPRLLSKLDVLRLLDISDRTLEKLVRARHFPPPLRLGKTVRWAEPVVQQWLLHRLNPQLSWEPVKRSVRGATKG